MMAIPTPIAWDSQDDSLVWMRRGHAPKRKWCTRNALVIFLVAAALTFMLWLHTVHGQGSNQLRTSSAALTTRKTATFVRRHHHEANAESNLEDVGQHGKDYEDGDGLLDAWQIDDADGVSQQHHSDHLIDGETETLDDGNDDDGDLTRIYGLPILGFPALSILLALVSYESHRTNLQASRVQSGPTPPTLPSRETFPNSVPKAYRVMTYAGVVCDTLQLSLLSLAPVFPYGWGLLSDLSTWMLLGCVSSPAPFTGFWLAFSITVCLALFEGMSVWLEGSRYDLLANPYVRRWVGLYQLEDPTPSPALPRKSVRIAENSTANSANNNEDGTGADNRTSAASDASSSSKKMPSRSSSSSSTLTSVSPPPPRPFEKPPKRKKRTFITSPAAPEDAWEMFHSVDVKKHRGDDTNTNTDTNTDTTRSSSLRSVTDEAEWENDHNSSQVAAANNTYMTTPGPVGVGVIGEAPSRVVGGHTEWTQVHQAQNIQPGTWGQLAIGVVGLPLVVSFYVTSLLDTIVFTGLMQPLACHWVGENVLYNMDRTVRCFEGTHVMTSVLSILSIVGLYLMLTTRPDNATDVPYIISYFHLKFFMAAITTAIGTGAEPEDLYVNSITLASFLIFSNSLLLLLFIVRRPCKIGRVNRLSAMGQYFSIWCSMCALFTSTTGRHSEHATVALLVGFCFLVIGVGIVMAIAVHHKYKRSRQVIQFAVDALRRPTVRNVELAV